MASHFAWEYFGEAWRTVAPIVTVLAFLGCALYWPIHVPGVRRIEHAARSLTVAVGWVILTSLGFASLVCWALGSGAADILGAQSTASPAEATAAVMLVGAVFGLAIAGMAKVLASAFADGVGAGIALVTEIATRRRYV